MQLYCLQKWLIECCREAVKWLLLGLNLSQWLSKKKSNPSITGQHSSLLFNFQMKVFFSHLLFGVTLFLCALHVIQDVSSQVCIAWESFDCFGTNSLIHFLMLFLFFDVCSFYARIFKHSFVADSIILGKLIRALLLTCVSSSGPSSAGWAGREFALTFMQNYRANYDTPRIQLYITAVEANAKVTVEVPPLNFKQEKTLNAGEGVTIILPNKVEINGITKSPNTVRIQASADVTVTSFNSKLYTADTTVVYPITDWGKEYFIFTPARSPYGTYKEFAVTNGKESNKVEIFPQGAIWFQHRAYKTGNRLVIDLKPYESVQVQSLSDLSGTRVASQHPVAVFTGHSCTWRFSKCNHVYEQLLPVSSWGSSFMVPPLSLQKREDSVYIQASQPTRVTVQNGNRQDVFTLSRGQMREVMSKNPATLFIKADHGIQVLFLFNGLRYGWFQFYDPFLMMVLSTDHLCSSYSLHAQDGFDNKALIVAQTNAMAELRFDGTNLPRNVQWKQVAGTEFSWAEMTYKPSPGNQRHTVTSSGSHFALYSIGVSQMNGYGSPAQCIQPGKEQIL